MTEKKPGRFLRSLRILFRWSRISVWLLVLALLVAVIYVNSIGLPDFLKDPLLAELRERGWNVEFQRMRWRWFRGVVVDQAKFSPVDKDSHTTFSARRAELNVDFSRIKDSKVTLKSILINEGKLITAIDTNAAPLQVENIDATVRFLPGDRLVIDPFEAHFRDVRFELSCDLTNASALQELSFLLPETQPTDASETAVKKWFEAIQQIEFLDQPEVLLTVSGDVRKWQTMSAQLKIVTAGATTPWGKFMEVDFYGEMNPHGTTNVPVFSYDLNAGDIQTPWGGAESLENRSQFTLSNLHSNTLDMTFELSASQLSTGWGTGQTSNSIQSASSNFSGNGSLSLTNFLPIIAAAEVELGKTKFHWNSSEGTDVTGTLNHAAFELGYDPGRHSPDLGESVFWKHLQPFTLEGEFDFARVNGAGLTLDQSSVQTEWHWPDLDVKTFKGVLDSGELAADAKLNVLTRKLSVNANSHGFDLRSFSPVLPDSAKQFLAEWHWEKPPRIEGSVRLSLPAWDELEPNWNEAIDSMVLDAHVMLDNSRYRGLQTTFASCNVAYSNRVWRLPNLEWICPDGELKMNLVANETAKRFKANLIGALDPAAFRPLLPLEQQEWLDQVTFASPPQFDLAVTGQWNEMESLAATGKISAEAFTVRGVDFSSIAARVDYANFVGRFDDLILRHHDRQVEADRITLTRDRIYFNNVASTIDPMLVAHVIGEVVIEVLSPYKFAEPPHILLNGSLGLQTIEDADMHFQIAGEKFQWGLLQADAGSGTAMWVNESLTLTNLNALAYGGGTLAGNAFIDFTPGVKADYRLSATCTNVDVQTLVLSLNGTNQIEGRLNGTLNVHSADTTGLHTWNGSGSGELTDGLIWEMRIFGIFTPILDAIVPGLGKSRARSATTDFVITNGVAFSDDLEIRSSGFRMQYRGTLSHDGEINARVIAEPLRDTWAVGKILSTALLPISKLFEYKVTGPVENPQTKPVYMPKALMMALRPIKTIRGLLPDEDEESTPPDPTPVLNP